MSVMKRLAPADRGRCLQPGGDVDAAMKIGQIIRENEWPVTVSGNSKCFSSCALIYIAGVSRMNVGVIGLHRPYFE